VSDVIRIDRGLPAKVGLLDRGNNFVCMLERAEARGLISRGEVEILGSRGKMRAVRWISPEGDEPERESYAMRRRGYGDSHRRETPENPRGVWTIDRIRDRHRGLFTRVMDDCRAA